MKLNRSHKIVLAALLAAQNFTGRGADAPTPLCRQVLPNSSQTGIFSTRTACRAGHGFPATPPLPPAPREPDSFSLVGIIGYGEGRLAGVHVFFDGSSLQYQKEAQLNDTIANFKVAGISADSVTLVSGTNTMVLEIGEQLHDDTNGDWFFSNGTTVRYSDTGGSRFDNRFGNGRNSFRGGFGGRRRNNNFGNGGYNNGNNRIRQWQSAISTGAETTLIRLRQLQAIRRRKTRMRRLHARHRSIPFKTTRWLPTIRTFPERHDSTRQQSMTMKTIIKLTLAAALAAGTLEAFAQDDVLARLRAQRAQQEQQLGGQQAAETTPSPSADTGTVGAGDANAATTVPPASAAPFETADDNSARPEASFTNDVGTNGITMNFRNAPLSRVLSYMSDAAGFIIVLDTPVSGYVNVISTHPMTKDEAVDLLNTVLNQNQLAAIRDGRTLTIMTKAQAIHDDIPVVVGSDPANIPKNDEIVTQIIPIRFVDSQQLVVDLSPFVSSQATIVANQEGNSIIITDTQSNIRHLVKIIESIDSSAEMETKVAGVPIEIRQPERHCDHAPGSFPEQQQRHTVADQFWRQRRRQRRQRRRRQSFCGAFWRRRKLGEQRQRGPDSEGSTGHRRGGRAHPVSRCDRCERHDAAD